MKIKNLLITAVAAVIAFGMAACKNEEPLTRKYSAPDGNTSAARAFIDFSGYNGAELLTSHQPPSANPERFTLDNGITGYGIRFSHDGESTGVVIKEYGGRMAARTEDGSGYLYFFIDNYNIKNAETVTLEVTLYDNYSGNVNLQYRRRGNTIEDRFYRKAIPRSGSNTYVTIKIELDNCSFSRGEQQNQGAQFRFDNSVVIQRIELVEGGMVDPASDLPPPFAPSTSLNNMIGKGVAGYQAWFNASGSQWHHWGGGSSGGPGPGNVNVELWPAGWEDYLTNGAALHDTNFRMPDGSIARLFNSHDTEIIRTHHKWMQDAEIDGSAVQRFFESTSAVDTGNMPSHLTKIRDAAEEYGRIFYVMYDMSAAGRYNQDDVIKQIQLDWTYNIENKGIVSSPNYAKAEGKPVVCIWGVHAVERTDDNRYIKVEATFKLVQWFRDRGYYIIGGIPDDTFWERNRRGREMYAMFDMISPWYIGRDVTGQILGGRQSLNRALEFCREHPRSWADNQPIAFMPTVWPGFAWTNMSGNSGLPNHIPRNEGKWIWTQIQGYLNRDAGNVIRSLYFAMFDEYDEATNWMKAASDFFDIPLDQYFKTHAADGKWLSADYYLRMARAASQALQKKLAAGRGSTTAGAAGYTGPLNDYNDQYSIIVEHSFGPVLWRNSFERRNGRLKYGAGEGQPGVISAPVGHLQVDVGVPSGGVKGVPRNVTVTGAFTVNRPALGYNDRSDSYTPPSTTLGMVYTGNAKSGGSAFRLAGNKTAADASYLYKIAETRIKINPGSTLDFWQRAENALGANVTVDLLLNNGVYLSETAGYNLHNDGPPQNGWQKKTVNIPAVLEGRYITEVIIAYRDNSTATGSFAALIDDIVILNN